MKPEALERILDCRYAMRRRRILFQTWSDRIDGALFGLVIGIIITLLGWH